ncbi:MAG: trigger factor [Micrococcales bacterium]|nr:trigger factor [Micrococcales bacterium]
MKSAVETLESTKVKLTVDVAYADLKPAITKAYKEIAGQVNVPGFRKGHVPARVIDARFGRGVVMEQAINDSLSDWYRQALDQHKLFPMAQPEVDITSEPPLDADEPEMTFTAVVEVRPEIKLPSLGGIEVTVPVVTISDEQVEMALDALRERFGSLKTVDRPAQDGDFVTIDLKAEKGEQEIDSVSGISYQIGSKDLVDGLDEALTGLSADETTSFETEMAGGEHAGENALVTVTPTAVKERELPDLDDDFAQEVSEFDTLEELRKDARIRLEQQVERDQVVLAQDKLVETLLEQTDFEAPKGVVEQDAKNQLSKAGKEDDEEALEAALRDSAKAVRTQLLLDAMVEYLQVTANQGELTGFIVQTAQRYGMDPNQFLQTAADHGELPQFYAELVRSKALVKALRQVKVQTEAGDVIDIEAKLGPEQVEEPQGEGELVEPAEESGIGQEGYIEDLTADLGQGELDQLAIEIGGPEEDN